MQHFKIITTTCNWLKRTFHISKPKTVNRSYLNERNENRPVVTTGNTFYWIGLHLVTDATLFLRSHLCICVYVRS